VNRDAFRQTLQTEEARVWQELRIWRRVLWFLGIFGSGMAVWAGFWIAITIANGWSTIYAIASGVSLGLFALSAGASWLSRGRGPERTFGDTPQELVRGSLALVDYQLSITGRWIFFMGMVSLVVGAGLFSWTTISSQDIPDSSSGGGWFWFTVLFVAVIVWASSKARDEMRQAKPKLELRRRRLRALPAALEARD
jgi:hypothetical protein